MWKNAPAPVDRTHLVKAKEWARSPLLPETLRQIGALRHSLRAERYDLCIDLQGAVRSALAGRLAGAPRMIGEDRPREWAARWLFSERVADPWRARDRAGCGSLRRGCRGTAFPCSSPTSGRLRGGTVGGGRAAAQPRRPVVLLSPGAGWGAKRWPAERYGAVAAICMPRAALCWSTPARKSRRSLPR